MWRTRPGVKTAQKPSDDQPCALAKRKLAEKRYLFPAALVMNACKGISLTITFETASASPVFVTHS